MAKCDFLPDSWNRNRRIIGRIICSKRLPDNVYRIDDRPPQTIRQTGFQPWNGGGNITLMEHVNNAYAAGPNQGLATKKDSQWVSTGAYGLLKHIDPVFAQKLYDTHIYKIDSAVAAQTGAFMDANDEFDRAGVNRPYATQREWIKLGGIDQQAVTEYMTGTTFAQQLNNFVAPDEDQLQGWTAF